MTVFLYLASESGEIAGNCCSDEPVHQAVDPLLPCLPLQSLQNMGRLKDFLR